jgi:hypothetical protein
MGAPRNIRTTRQPPAGLSSTRSELSFHLMTRSPLFQHTPCSHPRSRMGARAWNAFNQPPDPNSTEPKQAPVTRKGGGNCGVGILPAGWAGGSYVTVSETTPKQASSNKPRSGG